MVDVVVNAPRRALMGNLGIAGWRNIPRLMIHRRKQYIGILAFGKSLPRRREWSYMDVLHHFSKGGKGMIAPRYRRRIQEVTEKGSTVFHHVAKPPWCGECPRMVHTFNHWAESRFILRLECAGMLQSVPELGTNLGTNSGWRELFDRQLAERNGGQGRD